ncbi:MAG: Crp/Fnr family transcriptional regulator [Pseudomonadota bacterium]|nr:Crp/Fnr family transcriptional regulator [Pseudomonadota bacterium]
MTARSSKTRANSDAQEPAPAVEQPPVAPSADEGTGPSHVLTPIPEPALREIAAAGTVRRFPARTILLNEGDRGDSLYIILTGKVKVFASNETGKEVVIGTMAAGDYFGEMSLDGSPRSASVMTTEATTCAVVPLARFVEFVEQHPEFALHLVRTLIARCRTATESIKSLALSDVYGRLVRLLNALATTADGRVVIAEKFTHQDIAERIGASRDMVSRLMKDLVAGGYLALEQRTIIIRKKLPTGW